MRLRPTVLLVIAMATGCAGRFDVAPSPRVQVLSTAGRGEIAKDGYTTSVGRFGDGLDWAVKGVPAAEREAAKYRAEVTSGDVTSAIGVAGMVSGFGLEAAAFKDQGPEVDAARRPAGDRAAAVALVAVVAGLGGVVAGQLVREHAKRHVVAAADRYNATLP